uniref:ORC4_C domain-containing protein n=1 Tax=Heterorhabditis bacteriophora TaxID=37862 RepID=A0A1I7WT08_HETBA
MDAKRRRINEDSVGDSKDYSGLISSSTLKDSSLFENLSAITAEHLKTKDFVELQRHLSWFKRYVVRKDLTVFFVDQSKSSGTFSAIVDLFIKCTTELSDPRFELYMKFLIRLNSNALF